MSENTKQEGTQEVTIKYDSWLLKLIKTHGLSVALMLGGLWFLNGKLTLAETRITALEDRLYDCYEKRITTLQSSIPFMPTNEVRILPLAVLPNQKKNKYDNSFL